jgi:Putative Actinobacterial Holin-X, holin superfamily III
MAYHEEKRTIATLFTDVIAETTELFRAEIHLIRAEIRQSADRLANSGTLIGVGAIAALAALFLLLQAVVAWLAFAGLPERWGYTIVGVVIGVLAAGLLVKGIDNLKATKVVPERTIEQLKADFATVKEHVQ